MSRIDVNNVTAIEVTEKYYIIEEQFADSGKWYRLGDRFYLPEYEFGQNSCCGECWQKTGQHGMYDLEYATEYCNKLNEALKNGTLPIYKPGWEIAKFRLAAVEWTYKKQVIVPERY